MSAINLSGNASGSGTFTIASPNSNTSYTLALPEEAGTITTSNSPYSTFRNRIINGNMVIDQRNAGASVTLTGTTAFPVDRFFAIKQTSAATLTAQQSTVAPAGFTNSLLFTVSTGASPAAGDINATWQTIEGFNVADLGWGTANAQSITVSFWVRSSVTGTYAFSFNNSSVNRFYVATYTVSAANTLEYKTVTIPGDTSGTWLTDNGRGIQITWDLGYGSNFNGTAGVWGSSTVRRTSGSIQLIATTGATFYLTGVQLEVGSVATPFERRPYGTELSLCQRYYYKALGVSLGVGFCQSTTQARFFVPYPVPMRVAPSALEQNGTAADYTFRSGNSDFTSNSVPIFGGFASTQNANVLFSVASGLTEGRGAIATTSTGFLAWSAEL